MDDMDAWMLPSVHFHPRCDLQFTFGGGDCCMDNAVPCAVAPALWGAQGAMNEHMNERKNKKEIKTD